MLDPTLLLGFIAATVVLILIPGPNVILIVANALGHGPRRALATVAGTTLAQAVQIAVVVLGLSSLAAVLADAFEWLRWIGVAYLIWLGVRQWREDPVVLGDVADVPAALGPAFWQGGLVALTNPKTLAFHAAFLPQFVNPALPALPQLTLLAGIFLLIALLIDSAYALLAGRLRPMLRGRRGATVRNRVSGGFLIGAGIGLALARKS